MCRSILTYSYSYRTSTMSKARTASRPANQGNLQDAFLDQVWRGLITAYSTLRASNGHMDGAPLQML